MIECYGWFSKLEVIAVIIQVHGGRFSELQVCTVIIQVHGRTHQHHPRIQHGDTQVALVAHGCVLGSAPVEHEAPEAPEVVGVHKGARGPVAATPLGYRVLHRVELLGCAHEAQEAHVVDIMGLYACNRGVFVWWFQVYAENHHFQNGRCCLNACSSMFAFWTTHRRDSSLFNINIRHDCPLVAQPDCLCCSARVEEFRLLVMLPPLQHQLVLHPFYEVEVYSAEYMHHVHGEHVSEQVGGRGCGLQQA